MEDVVEALPLLLGRVACAPRVPDCALDVVLPPSSRLKAQGDRRDGGWWARRWQCGSQTCLLHGREGAGAGDLVLDSEVSGQALERALAPVYGCSFSPHLLHSQPHQTSQKLQEAASSP